MKRTVLLSFFAIAATAFAASNTYKVNLTQDSVVEGKTLKAGDYKVSVENGTATFKQGKQSVEVPARVENETNKIPSTEVTYTNNTQLQEIRVGGTHAKIVLDGSAPMQTGQ